jgi:hypothetical protein
VYDTFAGQFAFESGNSGFPVIELGQRITLVVRNEAGEALGGVRVTIEVEQQSGTLLDMPTRSDGRIVFSTGADGASSATEFLVTVYPPDGSAPETFTEDLSSGSWELVLSGQNAALPVQLDLAFVVDATGSMMDELQYIQVEMTDIVAAISEAFPNVDQRYALIVYRDQGDDYVTRTFDFTGSLEAFNADLSAQRAGGGGDYPEAMHTALQEAEGLSWRGDGTAQVIFLIADAPPHNQDAQAAFDSGMRLRSQGVVIYPVAASGVASEAEYVMRTAALLTGTQYCFLTDDSGVGNPHAEPFVPCYEVERLNRLMVRVISAELMGERLFPDEQDVIRTVGNPVDGVCVDAGQEQGRGQ